MATPTLYSPKDTAQRLDIATSTLRSWSQRFAGHLSDHANPVPVPSGRVGRRLYSGADLETLARVKTLLDSGLTFDSVATALLTSEAPVSLPAVVNPGALAESGEITRALVAVSDLAIEYRRQLADLQASRDDLERRVLDLERDRRPIWLRWFRR